MYVRLSNLTYLAHTVEPIEQNRNEESTVRLTDMRQLSPASELGALCDLGNHQRPHAFVADVTFMGRS